MRSKTMLNAMLPNALKLIARKRCDGRFNLLGWKTLIVRLVIETERATSQNALCYSYFLFVGFSFWLSSAPALLQFWQGRRGAGTKIRPSRDGQNARPPGRQ